MNVVKLNCAACGAPISIPEDLEILICNSCGSKLAVDRGDGYTTLKLVEKLTQAIQESGDKTHSALRENTFVTKTELKKVQISQAVNTEEMKLNSLRQEIRGLTRKAQLMPVESQQLTALRLDECESMQRVRKLIMDAAKLDEGWEENLEIFREDLERLDGIIKAVSAKPFDPQLASRLADLHAERARCEDALFALEAKILSRMLRSLHFAPVETLSVEQLEELREIIPSDLKILEEGPTSKVKDKLKNQVTSILKVLTAIYPRKKVESVTGPLASLDLKPPFSEIPWQLIPLIQLTEVDLEKVKASPDNPAKFLIQAEIEKIAKTLKDRQMSDIPGKRLMDEKRKKLNVKVTLFFILGMIVVAIIIILVYNASRDRNYVVVPYNSTTGDTSTQSAGYVEAHPEFLEVTAGRTYLRAVPEMTSQEGKPVEQGDLLYNLVSAFAINDWYHVETIIDGSEGYLLGEWVSPIHGITFHGTGLNYIISENLYQWDFSGEVTDWYQNTFASDLGHGEYVVKEGSYQIWMIPKEDSYAYALTDDLVMPGNILLNMDINHYSSDSTSEAGFLLNFIDDDNYDFFTISPTGRVIVGATRNGTTVHYFDTDFLPNDSITLNRLSANDLTVLIESSDSAPTRYSYAVNGIKFFTLEYERHQSFTPAVGVIVFTEANGELIEYHFDNVSVDSVTP